MQEAAPGHSAMQAHHSISSSHCARCVDLEGAGEASPAESAPADIQPCPLPSSQAKKFLHFTSQ